MRLIFPIATLLFLATVLPELITGSTPVLNFLDPGYSLYLLLIGYGIPVLIIREIAAHWRVNWFGVFFMGIGYGIFNEAILAKTAILTNNLPVAAYDQYGVVFGISVPWIISISIWHALASVVAPIAITHALFPREEGNPWLPLPLLELLPALLFAAGSARFLSTDPVAGTPYQLVIFLVSIVLFVLAGRLFQDAPVPLERPRWHPLWLGFITILVLFQFVLAPIAAFKLHGAIFFGILIAGFWFLARILRRFHALAAPAIALFSIGVYLQNAALGAFFAKLFQRPLVLETEAVVVPLLLVLAWYIVHKKAPQMEVPAA